MLGFFQVSLVLYSFPIFSLLLFLRFLFRTFFRVYYFGPSRKKRKDILVVGAGSAGEQLIRDMVRSGQSRYLPVGIIDDDLQKKNTFIHGIRVLGDRKTYRGLLRILM